MSTEKPSKNEDEYFAKRDAELLKAQRAKLNAERAAAKQMAGIGKCPRCGVDLLEQEQGPVTIDICPNCNGMWLDAGELEMMSNVKETAIAGFFKDVIQGFRRK